MMIQRKSLMPFDFEGLEIRDYTADRDCSSSVAEICVPGGARHRRAWSKRSDRFYTLHALGVLLFDSVAYLVLELAAGDLCIIQQGDRFSYENTTEEVAKVLLVHTPSFDLSQEVFEDERGFGPD